MENKERDYVTLNGEKVELGSTDPSTDKPPRNSASRPKKVAVRIVSGLVVGLSLFALIFTVIIAPRVTLDLVRQANTFSESLGISNAQMDDIKFWHSLSLYLTKGGKENMDSLIALLEDEAKSAKHETEKTASEAPSYSDLFAPNDDSGPGLHTEMAQRDNDVVLSPYFGKKVYVFETMDTYYLVIPEGWRPEVSLDFSGSNKDVVVCEGCLPSLRSNDLLSYSDYAKFVSLLPEPPTEPATVPPMPAEEDLTPIQPLATVADTGEPISSRPAGPWEGPID